MNVIENIKWARRAVRSYMLKKGCNVTLNGLERLSNALPK